MNVKHLLLGIAIVGLMAACGSKATETPTETAVETPVETVTETPAETATATQATETPAPAKKAAKAPKAKATKPAKTAKAEPKAKEDPCEKTVADYESFATRINTAKQSKGTGAAALKEYMSLKKEASAKEAAVRNCASNSKYTTRVQHAIASVKKATL